MYTYKNNMQIGLIDCGSRYIEELYHGLSEAGVEVHMMSMEVMKKADFEGLQGLVISGSPTNLSEIDGDRILGRFDVLNELTVPIFGVCFGHQVIAVMHGARIWKAKERVADVAIQVLEPSRLAPRMDNTLMMAERHEEYVSLPEGFVHLATSDSCEVEMIKHETKEVYGTQFHPELSGESGAKILGNFVTICRDDVN